jgi:hypothetical protein
VTPGSSSVAQLKHARPGTSPSGFLSEAVLPGLKGGVYARWVCISAWSAPVQLRQPLTVVCLTSTASI